ncbi:Breast carcinoma-amplified sequence 4 [Chelonia mydas]|uniref:Breast carcinoma-amplified sequence 4 n=1 Tax=Chelonia mydas TaxID=8469 RepID=M7BJA3_CHEMY|nr:Breast carcinoma-amplified sequence 4 [Chelonia mydas]
MQFQSMDAASTEVGGMTLCFRCVSVASVLIITAYTVKCTVCKKARNCVAPSFLVKEVEETIEEMLIRLDEFCGMTDVVKEVEETIEEMLIRLDEFCGMTDVIRSDTSQILDETIPLIKAKVVEMNNIYAKVDKLEAFVKMVGRHVSFLEEQVLQAEGNHNTVSHAVRKLLQSAAIPSFKNQKGCFLLLLHAACVSARAALRAQEGQSACFQFLGSVPQQPLAPAVTGKVLLSPCHVGMEHAQSCCGNGMNPVR